MLVEGNELSVEPSSLTIINEGEIDVVVIVDDVEYSIDAGSEVRFATLVELLPDTLNLDSNGKWITASIMLQQPYDANQIKIETVKLTVNNYEFSVDLTAAITIEDYNHDGIVDLMIKFLRQPVISALSVLDYSVDAGNISQEKFIVSGDLNDGTSFKGTDTINILSSKR